MASARCTILKGGQRKVQSYFDQSCGSIRPQLYSFGTRFYHSPCFGHIPARCTLFSPPPFYNRRLVHGNLFFFCDRQKIMISINLDLDSHKSNEPVFSWRASRVMISCGSYSSSYLPVSVQCHTAILRCTGTTAFNEYGTRINNKILKYGKRAIG